MSNVLAAKINRLPPSVQIQRLIGNDTQVLETYKIEDCKKELSSFARKDPISFPYMRFGGVSVKLSETARVVINDDFTCRGCGKKAEYASLYRTSDAMHRHYGILFYHVEKGKVCNHTKDHVVPKSLGGDDTFSNYQNLCRYCNHEKGNDDTELPFIEVKGKDSVADEEIVNPESLSFFLRYPLKPIKIDDRNSHILYMGEELRTGNMGIVDVERLDMLLLSEGITNKVARDVYTYKTGKFPWYVRLFGIDKIINAQVKCYREHILKNISDDMRRYIEYSNDFQQRNK